METGIPMAEEESELRIYTYPEPVLRTEAEPVIEIDEDMQTLVEGMLKTMYAAPGIGLAANQVGALRRVIVFDGQPTEEGRSPCVLINPEIVLGEGSITYEEACLSVVDYAADVTRNARIKVRGVDRDGNPLDIEAEDLLAICLQHEIDHLDGVLYIDHISSLKRALYKKKLKKMLKNG
jgi:peptide deformylase